MRGQLRPTTAAEAVARARSMIGFEPELLHDAPDDAREQPIRYRLAAGHNGGSNPNALHPASWSFGHRTPTADCTGFVCWSLGFDRFQPHEFPHYGGWVNTDSAILDSQDSQSFFERIAAPEPGCVVIYGGKKKDGKRIRIGHWGIVAEVPAEFDPAIAECWNAITVVHCSSSQSRRTGAAIAETPARLWFKKHGRFLRYVRSAV